jgi:Zn-dependent protease with chaperone function
LISASPTLVALETDSAWIVILAVSFVTLALVMVVRRVLDSPGGVTSGIFLSLPLVVPLVAAAVYQSAVFPEVAVLRPAGNSFLQGAHVLFLADEEAGLLIPYQLTGSPGLWLFFVGALVSSFMLVRRGLGLIAINRLMKRCDALDPEARSAIDPVLVRLASTAELKDVPVVLVLPPDAPGAFCSARGTGRIFVSKRLLADLEPDELEALLAHEVAHLKAKDVSIVCISGFLRDLVAWNPVAHYAHRRLLQDRELEADRRAAALTGHPLAVASSLLKVCESMRVRPRTWRRATVVSFLRPQGRVSKRVGNLLALADHGHVDGPPRHLPFVASAILAAILALQVGAQLSTDETPFFGIVWGAPGSSEVQRWRADALPSKTKQRHAAGEKKHSLSKSARRQAQKAVRVAALRDARLTDPYAIREKDFPRWIQAMRAFSIRKDGPGSAWMPSSGWRAEPVFNRSAFGSLVVRIEPQLLKEALSAGRS